MQKRWSWVDKTHRTRLAPGKWNRIVFIEDKTGARHEGGTVTAETGIHAEAQLYFGVTKETPYISLRFTRVYPDGRVDDQTGYADFPTVAKATRNIVHDWIGTMTPEFRLVVEERHPTGTVVLGTRIYKGYE